MYAIVLLVRVCCCLAQVSFLDTHPGVTCVGSGVDIVSETSSRVCVLPHHPSLLKWHMLFYCALAHPTIMARAQVGQLHLSLCKQGGVGCV